MDSHLPTSAGESRPATPPAPLDDARLLREATDIARQIAHHRLRAKDGSAAWRGARQSTPDGPHALGVLGPHLYDGTPGIALFLAALQHVAPNAEYRELALDAIAPLRRKLADIVASPDRARGLQLAVGGLKGVGGFLYTLVALARFLEDDALRQEARAVAGLFYSERIAADEQYDVMAGSAGAILALLAMDALDPGADASGATPVDHAMACAQHLLRTRLSFEGRPRAWPPLPALAPLTGFSHGAAGICLALLRLHQRTGAPALRDAALEGLDYERGLYAPAHHNWRDMRRPEPRFMTSWCHGAPGILLARLAMANVAPDVDVRADIENGLVGTCAVRPSLVDDLCCGNMGLVDILLYAHQTLGRAALREEAHARARQVLDRAQEAGHFGLPLADQGVFSPGLFKGAAGIGYTLLRLARPSLPCILLLA